MAGAKLTVEFTNGGLGGLIGTTDGVAGMVLSGVAATGLALNTAQRINSLSDAEELGIDETFDSTNTVKAWDNIKKFYDEAGQGKELWIMLVAETESMTDICDYDGSNPRLKDLLDASSGKIRIVGVQRSPASGYVPTVTNGIDDDVYTAATEMQTTLTSETDLFRPCVGVLDGLAYNGTDTDLTDLTTLTNSRVSILLSNSDKENASNPHLSTAVGSVVGRLAKNAVNISIGRVKDGALKPTDFYLETVSSETITQADIDALADKGYLFARPWMSKTGFFFDGDPTATATTDDYKTISLNRTINKVVELAYGSYVNEINEEVPINSDGTIPEDVASNYEGLVSLQIGKQMLNTGEISDFSVFIDPNQDLLTSGQLVVEIAVIPTATLREIKIKLGFTNSLS